MTENKDYENKCQEHIKQDNVLPLDQWRGNPYKNSEKSLDQLLTHMRQVREAIPVNENLREELRRKLTNRNIYPENSMDGPTNTEQLTSTPPGPGKKKNYLALGAMAAFVMVIVIGAIAFSIGARSEKILEAGEQQLMTGFWVDNQPLVPAASPKGEIILVARGGSLLVLDGGGNQRGLVRPPENQGYGWPSWSPDGDKLALVRQTADKKQEILVVDLPQEKSAETLERLLTSSLQTKDSQNIEKVVTADSGSLIAQLSWSPKGAALAYTLTVPHGEPKVWLVDQKSAPKVLGTGSYPTWSPDGNQLVIQRSGENPTLWLVESKSGKASLLGEGEQPTWGTNGHMAFVGIKNREKVLSYMPDGSPQFSVLQRTGEIRTIYMGENSSKVSERLAAGESWQNMSNLLFAPDTGPGQAELDWLRAMELSGIRGPRTLTMDRVNNFQSLTFGPGGSSLLVARKDGSTISLLRMSLRERLVKRGENS